MFLLCHVGIPGNQWTAAQFGGVSLAHARTKTVDAYTSCLPVSKGFSSKNSGLVHILESSRGSFLQRSIESLKK